MCVRLTDKALDAEGLDLHVDQQSAVRLHQGWGQGKTRLGVGQFNDTGCNAVDQANGKNGRSSENVVRMNEHNYNTLHIHLQTSMVHNITMVC